MCRSAIEKGVAEIGFTEHFDLHPDEPCRDWFRPEPWWGALQQSRAEFADQLTVRAGIEVGEPHIFTQEMAEVVGAYPFDYVMGSLHWVGPESVFSRNYFASRPADVAFPLFFEELERMTRAGGFDILAHFDVPVRIGFAVYGEYDPRRYEESIRPVLRNCIEQGIALDLNTKALRSRPRVLTPGLDILRWYAEMGGERITLGSDAHRPKNIGADLDVALDVARQAGLRYLTFYEERQAQLQPIE
jgi:histidinol-phosphatase (PHP family)